MSSPDPVDYQNHPSRYRHWQRAVNGPVASLMVRVVEPGQFANWIAPPMLGINRQPADFDYVRFN